MARRWIVSTAWLCSFVSDVDQTWHAYSVVDIIIIILFYSVAMLLAKSKSSDNLKIQTLFTS